MVKKDDKEKIEELKRMLSQEGIISKEVPLIFDGNQYSLKIPKGIMDEFKIGKKNINEDDYIFKINLSIPPHHTDEDPKLNIELVKK